MFRKRNLPVKTLATDASPVSYWNSLQRPADMDDITDVYGGHHYATRQPAHDLEFYSWCLERCTWAVGLAKSKKKDYMLETILVVLPGRRGPDEVDPPKTASWTRRPKVIPQRRFLDAFGS